MSTNLKPADELATVRSKIKALQAREAELKAGMVSGDLGLSGDFAIVSITKRSRNSFDRKAAENEFGDLSRFDRQTEFSVVQVEELETADIA